MTRTTVSNIIAVSESRTSAMNNDAGPYLTFLQPVTDEVIRAVGLKPGQVVLDVGTGSGDPALDAARAVAPGGRVVGIDVAADRLLLARERAQLHNLENIAFQEMSALELGFPDGSFDAVLSRLVITYFPDPSRFLEEVFRVLKPGGRAAIAVWTQGEDHNPLLNLPMRVLRRWVQGDQEPANTAPASQRVSLGVPGVLEETMKQSGFQDTATGAVPLRLAVQESQAGDYWLERRAGSPASLRLLEQLPEDKQRLAQEEVVEAVRQLIASGRATGELIWAAGSKG